MVAKWAKQVNLSLFFILCAFPLLKPHLISQAAILMLCSGLVYLIASKEWKFESRFFLLMVAILIPYLLFLIPTRHFDLGSEIVQVKLMLLVLGLHFGFVALRPETKHIQTALNIFCSAALLIAVWGNLYIILHGYTHPIGLGGADFAYSYRVSLEEYTGLHPTYYCAIVYIAAFIKLFPLLNNGFNRTRQNLFWILLIVLCVSAGVLAASRATMMGFAAISAFFVLTKIHNHSHRWWILGGMIVMACSLLLVPSIKTRLLELNSKNMQAPGRDNDNGTNVRSGIFTCNGELLKEHWLLGLGTGNVQEALNDCLGKFDTHVYDIHNYNTHNEYLNSWLTCGLFGLIVFIGVLGFSFYLAFQHKNWLHIYILAFICFCFLTENYLERQAGVTLFALMQTLFLIQYKSNKTEIV